MKYAQRLVVFAFGLSLLLPLFNTPTVSAEADSGRTLIITEVKLGGDSFTAGVKDLQEFVSIFNMSNQEISLAEWKLQYAKLTVGVTGCSDLTWTDTNIANLTVPAKSTKSIVRSMTDSSDGVLRLIDQSDVQQDLVGWGEVPCFETASVARPSSGKSIKRYQQCNSLPLDTNNNSQDFAHNQPPSPGIFASLLKVSCEVPPPPEEETPPPANPPSQPPPVSPVTCEGVIVNEILPNPEGTDTGREYIEIYNPTDKVISMTGCVLQTSAGSKKYEVGNVSLSPNEYFAIHDTVSGLTLPNAAGGTVWLLSPGEEELQSIVYPGNLDDDQSWGLFTSGWQATFQPTPGYDNVLLVLKPCAAGQERSLQTRLCRSVAVSSQQELTSCREDQERNAETNRCRLIQLAATSLVVCSPGQERNLATNRCRTVLNTTSDLVPCREGQERNPETNRCRAVASTANALLPCDEGQERNPDTNRCRKSAAGSVAGIADVRDVSTGPIINSPRWLLALSAVIAALGYAVYEWRHEMLGFAAKLKSKM